VCQSDAEVQYIVEKWDLLIQGPRADKVNYQTVDKTAKWSIPILKGRTSPFGSIFVPVQLIAITE
jgi:hypothetical protein